MVETKKKNQSNRVIIGSLTTKLHSPREGEKYDPVNKPAHYNLSGGIECIDYIKQVLGKEGFVSYCHGNMVKYQHRHRYKQNPVEDLKKAQWYLDKMLETLKEIRK
tara:strand:- start:9291 stop:9608 length:318 start_codon:yes stop_codon:yes gene_type:complete